MEILRISCLAVGASKVSGSLDIEGSDLNFKSAVPMSYLDAFSFVKLIRINVKFLKATQSIMKSNS
ncbi:unnamed protein product [Ceratitis capitata]|uniref:(Mediterranean fruit fly) hypothetical protein n=1 Tax=Ceratitis capitata TaxID=7213 RepID=A0A811VBE3_CERCA|nr:unnamed protein product [Ceratitis capitata]